MPNSATEQAVAAAKRQKFKAPIWTLILLAPFIAEVLSGSTRATVLFVFIPEVMVWGVGALLCRELVRRWRAGGLSLLLLGLALSVAEEFLIQQTSIAPVPFPGAHADYGRVAGINLVYLLFMLGFESVWVVVVPVQIAELFHPQQREKPWLQTGSVIACVLVFLLGSFMAWFGWTQQARPALGAAPYAPPVRLLALGAGMIAFLALLAWALRRAGRASMAGNTSPVWLAGLTAAIMGFPWFLLIAQVFVPHPVQRFWLLVAMGLAWALVAAGLFLRWSAQVAWTEVHALWACVGATAACMGAPYLSIQVWPRQDVIGILIFDAIGLGVLTVLARKVYGRQQAAIR